MTAMIRLAGPLLALLISTTSHATETILASSGEHVVHERDIVLALAAANSGKRAALVANPNLMSQLIESILFNRILASRAGSSPAAAAPPAEDPLARDARLAEAYMAQAIGTPPDLSRFAVERHAANPEQWRIPATKQVQLLRTESKKLERELDPSYSAEGFTELATLLGATVQNVSVAADRQMDFEPRFWEAVDQLQAAGDTATFQEEAATVVVRLVASEPSRLRSRDEAVPLIVAGLEAEWKKSRTDRIMAELRQLEVVVDGAAVIALRDRVLREAEASKASQ